MVHISQKLGEEKGMLQFAQQNVLDSITSQFVCGCKYSEQLAKLRVGSDSVDTFWQGRI